MYVYKTNAWFVTVLLYRVFKESQSIWLRNLELFQNYVQVLIICTVMSPTAILIFIWLLWETK